MKKLIVLIVVSLVILGALICFRWQQKLTNVRIERMGHGLGINCVNNLNQIGLAFRIWSGNHGNRMPFNVSTNEGGTLELCLPDKDGFDQNAYLFLRAMSNELANVNVLVCPFDHSKVPASNWGSLTLSNISYRFHSGTNLGVASTKQVFAVCPIDGNILYSDGTWESKQPLKPDDSGQVPLHVQEAK